MSAESQEPACLSGPRAGQQRACWARPWRDADPDVHRGASM